mmetsp:Transcript_143/g.564  ORF Transcript_143/g.564 Transcript_143/m.564 type:complete len:200 (+) Transcript_143:1717-2316(+)
MQRGAVRNVRQRDATRRELAHDFEFIVELFQFCVAGARDDSACLSNDGDGGVRAAFVNMFASARFFIILARGAHVPLVNCAISARRYQCRVVIIPHNRFYFSTMTSQHRDGFKREDVVHVNSRANGGCHEMSSLGKLNNATRLERKLSHDAEIAVENMHKAQLVAKTDARDPTTRMNRHAKRVVEKFFQHLALVRRQVP